MKSKNVSNILNKQDGATSALIGISILILTLAGLVGLQLRGEPITSNTEAQVQQGETRFILPPTAFNNDIEASLQDPRSSGTWDAIVGGSLCFNLNPPTYGGKVRIALEMDVKDAPESEVVRSKTIGASVSKFLTNPNTTRCFSTNRRDVVFNAPFNLPDKDLWPEACPEIRILATTEGPWNPKPQEEIGRISGEYLCPGGIPSPSPEPSPSVSQSPSPSPSPEPTEEPVPESALEGHVTVYACDVPQDVRLKVCDDPSDDNCQTLSLGDEPSDNGLWLQDDDRDRTYVYKYKVTQNSEGEPVEPAQTFVVPEAEADIFTIRREQETFTSEPDESNNRISTPGSRDLTVNVEHMTCGCPFFARAYIKDASTGEILRTTRADLGAANDIQIQKLGDKLVQTFNNGVLDVRADFFDFAERFIADPRTPFSDHGIDGEAMVRLYAPGMTVVKQECESFGSIDACPGGTSYTLEDTSSNDFKGLRVGCGVELEYGWHVSEVPEYEPEEPPITPPDPYTHDSLLAEREGWGAQTTGGQGGKIYVVTTLADSKDNPPEGSLRWAVEKTQGPRIVKFAVDGVINLEDVLKPEANTTIDGRGRNIVIARNGIQIKNPRNNIIITNIKLTEGEDDSGDAIEIRDSENVWIHHVTAEKFTDGLIDIVQGSTNVTVSWSHLWNHDKVMLIGNGDHDGVDPRIKVTLHHNLFENFNIRSPLLRLGKVDMYNNYILGWKSTAVESRQRGQILAENNIFQAGRKHRAIITDNDNSSQGPGYLRSVGNLFLNEAYGEENEPDRVFQRTYPAKIDIADKNLQNRVLNNAGVIPPTGFSFSTLTIIDADVNEDGVVNTADLAICIEEYGQTYGLCDVNLDGDINALDHSGVTQFIGVDISRQ